MDSSSGTAILLLSEGLGTIDIVTIVVAFLETHTVDSLSGAAIFIVVRRTGDYTYGHHSSRLS